MGVGPTYTISITLPFGKERALIQINRSDYTDSGSKLPRHLASAGLLVMRPIADRAAYALDRPARVLLLPLSGDDHAFHLASGDSDECPVDGDRDVASPSGQRTYQK
jgi:hypothetical protein